MNGMSRVMSDVMARRRAQVTKGWTPEHDDHGEQSGTLVRAAVNYSLAAIGKAEIVAQLWPWGGPPPTSTGETYSQSRRLLIDATALLCAEIERLDRQHEAELVVLTQQINPSLRFFPTVP